MIKSITRLLSVLKNDAQLFELLFEKRNSLVYSSELEEGHDFDRIEFLLETELIVKNENTIELDERVLSFFEAFLETNDDVEISDISELLDNLSYNILQFKNNNDFAFKEKHHIKIIRILKKIPNMLLKNLNLLQLHISLVYKATQEFSSKKAELEHYKLKLEKLINIEESLETALESHKSFFTSLVSYETKVLYFRLKKRLNELQMSLVNLQSQVIEYLNKDADNTQFFQKIIQLKELKTAHELKEKSNIIALLDQEQTPLFLVPRRAMYSQLESDFVFEEYYENFIRAYLGEAHRGSARKKRADAVDRTFFTHTSLEEQHLDIYKLQEHFTKSEVDLFTFLKEQPFKEKLDTKQLLTLYAQMALNFDFEYAFKPEFGMYEGFEYIMIYAKDADECA